MTLDEAFEKLTSRRNWGALVGKTPNEACIYKTRFRRGTLTDDKKRELLNRSGLFAGVEEWVELPGR